jgi:hypothetical protein
MGELDRRKTAILIEGLPATSMGKMKEMHEKMHKGEMKMDGAQMKKLMKDVKAVSQDVEKFKNIGP